MMEKLKTSFLIFLVVLSLMQSYFLAYRLPSFGLMTRSDLDYVNSELLGQAKAIDDLIFPSQLIIHLGQDEHTMIYPKTQFYDLIISQRLANREFKGFQLVSQSTIDWELIKREQRGIELNFSEGISAELLKRVLKVDTDGLINVTLINKVLIYAVDTTEEVKAYFFDDEHNQVYEAVDVDLTVKDMQDYVGFGQYLPRYTYIRDQLYLASEPIQALTMRYTYDVISPEQMQRSLFFDSSATRAFVNRSGSQIYTDGKRGLQVEQNGLWITYTNSAASQTSVQETSENVYAAVDFVNQHGGWDTSYQFVSYAEDNHIAEVSFRKYILHYPIIDISPFRYGHIHLTTQQGVVMEYERTMIQLPAIAEEKQIKWLYGGELLQQQYDQHQLKDDIVYVYPALKPYPQQNSVITFEAVWAAKLKDGTEFVFMDGIPVTIEPEQLK